MGTVCSCDAEVEVTEFDVATRGMDPKRHLPEQEDLQCDLGKDGILGCSSIGTVVKTRCRGSGTVWAVKRISKRSIEGSGWKEEVMTLRKLDHRNVVKLHETVEDLMSLYLIMELCQGGNLMNISENVENFSEGTVAVLVRQMVSAVVHLHEHDIVHSDIRPENWLFQSPVKPQSSVLDMTLKMIDFGLASKHRRKRASEKQQLGPPVPEKPTIPLAEASTTVVKCRRSGNLRDFRRGLCCLAPEQLQGCADGKADVWALGVLTYFLLSGQSPFDLHAGVTSLEKHLSFTNARFVFMPPDIWRPISSEAKNFIALCLSKDPEQRPSAQHMLDLPWMVLAKGAEEEQMALRSPGRQVRESRWPGSFKSTLPTAPVVLDALSHMKMLQHVEQAAIVATAQSLHGEELLQLQRQLESMDQPRRGCVPLLDVLEVLQRRWEVPCEELLVLADGCDGSTIDYADFLMDVSDFQHNVQDAAISSVFRAFDNPAGAKVKIKRGTVAEVLRQESHSKTLMSAFPRASLEAIGEDLRGSPNTGVNFEELQSMLRTSRASRASVASR